jgi:hypothetical protein
MGGDIGFHDAIFLVRKLYINAVDERRFRPEQAFAYVQDEVESLHRSNTPGMNAVLQTAIYVEGARRGVKLSADSCYAQEMLDFLADVYAKCNVQALIEAGVDGEDLERLNLDMDFVRDEFLNSRKNTI